MTRRETELALKKQRLQMRSAALRTSFAGYAQTLTPLFKAADRGRAVVHWVRRHPALPVAGLVAMLVARPSGLLRWGRRGWIVWQAVGKLRSMIAARPTGGR